MFAPCAPSRRVESNICNFIRKLRARRALPGKDRAPARRGHLRAVALQVAVYGLFEGPERGEALFQLLFGDAQVDLSLYDVDVDDVAVPDDADGAARRRFGADVPDGGAARRARKPSVGDERDVRAQPRAHDGGGGGEHLAHPRAALRAFVADDDDVALHDLAAGDGLHRRFFAVEHLCGAAVAEHGGVDGALFHHRALRGDIALEDGEPARRGIGIVHRADDLLVQHAGVFHPFMLRNARNGHRGAVEQARLFELLYDGGDAARLVQILDIVLARGRELADVRHLFAHFVESVDGKVFFAHAHLVRQRQKVQHAVGRGADGVVHRHGVADRCGGQDIGGTYVLFHGVHHRFARLLREHDAAGVNHRDGAVAGQRHTQSLGEAVEAVRREHPRAGAAGGAGRALVFVQFRRVDLARVIGAHRLEHGGEGEAPAVHLPREHGPARYECRGQVQPHRRHQHPGDDLVAVAHENDARKGVRPREDLRAVRDDLAGGQGIAHPGVPHRDAVAHADGGHNDGLPACGDDALSDCLGNFVEVHMPGYDVALRADDADDGLVHLAVRPAQRAHQRTLGGHCRPFGKDVVHCGSPLHVFFRRRIKVRRSPGRSDQLVVIGQVVEAAAAARERGHARARHLEDAVRLHHLDKAVQLVRLAREFEDEAFGGEVDDLRLIDLLDLDEFGALFGGGGDLYEQQLAEDGAVLSGDGDLFHVDELVHLFGHLGEGIVVAVEHDGHAREFFVLRRAHAQAVDIEPAAGKQPGNAGEHAASVGNERGDCMLFHAAPPQSLVMTESKDFPGGIMGRTLSSMPILQSTSTGPSQENASCKTGAMSASPAMVRPFAPNASASFT